MSSLVESREVRGRVCRRRGRTRGSEREGEVEVGELVRVVVLLGRAVHNVGDAMLVHELLEVALDIGIVGQEEIVSDLCRLFAEVAQLLLRVLDLLVVEQLQGLLRTTSLLLELLRLDRCLFGCLSAAAFNVSLND